MKIYRHGGARNVLAALFLSSSPAFGASSDGHRQHGAHLHGSGSVEVVVEGHDLVVALRVPAVNVVGFEHDPGTDAERAALRQALATLGDPGLFRPSAAAGCKVKASQAEMVGMQDHGQAHADTDDHGHADDHDMAEGHAELQVSHAFHCERPQALATLEVLAFPHLLAMDELDAQVVTPSLQGAAELTPAATTLRLAP